VNYLQEKHISNVEARISVPILVLLSFFLLSTLQKEIGGKEFP